MKENSIDESLIIKEIRDSNYVVTKLILEYFQAKRSSEFKYLLLDGHLLSFKEKVVLLKRITNLEESSWVNESVFEYLERLDSIGRTLLNPSTALGYNGDVKSLNSDIILTTRLKSVYVDFDNPGITNSNPDDLMKEFLELNNTIVQIFKQLGPFGEDWPYRKKGFLAF